MPENPYDEIPPEDKARIEDAAKPKHLKVSQRMALLKDAYANRVAADAFLANNEYKAAQEYLDIEATLLKKADEVG